MIDLQGQAAANNGVSAETKVANIIEAFGGKVVQHRDLKNDSYNNEHTLLVKNRPYINMFGKKGRGDFYLQSAYLNKPLCIEVRSQKVKGSASEKIPTLFFNCKSIGTDNVVIVLDGAGHDPYAIKWLKDTAEKEREVNIKVMTISEFTKYVETSFKNGEVC